MARMVYTERMLKLARELGCHCHYKVVYWGLDPTFTHRLLVHHTGKPVCPIHTHHDSDEIVGLSGGKRPLESKGLITRDPEEDWGW